MATAHGVYSEQAQPVASGSRTSWWSKLASFPVMCMFLMTGRLLSFSVQQFTESDLWWHLRTAQNLLQHHSFSGIDAYSFTAAGSSWISFEWLSEVVYFLSFKAMGLQGILLMFFAVLVLIFTGVYYLSWRAGANCKDAAITTFAAICIGGVSIGPRTLLFGWLCMSGLLLILERFRRAGKGLWMIPPLFCLWINFHGSWPFGMVVLVITIVSGLVEGKWGLVAAVHWSPAELQSLLMALVTSGAAVFLNPFGYKLVFYPLDLLFHQHGVMQFIEEWHPVDFSTLNGKFALALIFGLLAAILFSRQAWKLHEVLLSAFALWTALSHVRFMFFAGLTIMPILAPRLSLFPPYERDRDKAWLNAAIIGAVVIAMIYFFPSESRLQRMFDEEYPKAALAFMQKNHIQGRIFNQYKFGGYMEFHTPEFKTFIDGRADLFTHKGVFYDYLQATALDNSFEILDKYSIQYVLLQPNEPLVYMLKHSPYWRSIYKDQVATLYERVTVAGDNDRVDGAK